MNWKEFFKPSKGKLLVVLVIVLLWPNYAVHTTLCGGNGCQEAFLDVYFFDLILRIGGDPTPKLFYNTMNFILSVIVSYGIGCTVIYGLSKINKKS